jgi:hypothetical protein
MSSWGLPVGLIVGLAITIAAKVARGGGTRYKHQACPPTRPWRTAEGGSTAVAAELDLLSQTVQVLWPEYPAGARRGCHYQNDGVEWIRRRRDTKGGAGACLRVHIRFPCSWLPPTAALATRGWSGSSAAGPGACRCHDAARCAVPWDAAMGHGGDRARSRILVGQLLAARVGNAFRFGSPIPARTGTPSSPHKPR